MTYESFSIFLNPVLICDASGIILFANHACSEAFDTKSTELHGRKFPSDFHFQPEFPVSLSQIKKRTPYTVATFEMGLKKGSMAYAVEPLAEMIGDGRYLVSFYDRLAESKVLERFDSDRDAKSSLEEEVLNQRADLLIVNNQLSRKITQTEFLLKFYARTRFALETDAIARQFLQLACVDLGFRHGYFFAYSEPVQTWRLGSYFYPEIQQEHSMKLQSESQKDIVNPPFMRIGDRVNVLSPEMLNDARLLSLYADLGVNQVANGAVLSLRKGNQPIGEFHFLNYVHNQRIGESALDMLRYMVDPVHLTFENAELYRTSVTDELTQINNVRYFRIRLQNELARVQKDKGQLALLMLDIDHFKSINDKYGHQVGDHAIKAMANALKMGVRGGDIVARYGGEEMAAILPGATPETALIVAERLRAHIGEIVIDSDLGPVKFTTSVGVSIFPADATEMEPLIHCADQALYTAKHNGRNQVVKF